jgi:hypothetical protein
MTNQGQNQLENPKYLRMQEELNEKFREKGEHEESDVTGWSGTLVFVLHAIIAMITVSIVLFLDLSKVEKVAFGVVLAVGAVCLESFKSRYMERYFVAFLKSIDLKQTPLVRKSNDKKAQTNKTILIAFWTVSVIIFTISGIKYAAIASGKAEVIGYDTSLKNVLETKTKALNAAQKDGVGAKTLRLLTEDLQRASQDWQRHTAAIDAKNGTLADEHENHTWFYGLGAIFLCAFLEVGLFFMRQFHERTQYKIATSVNDALGITSSTPSVKTDLGVNEWELKYKQLQDSYADLSNKYTIAQNQCTKLASLNEALERLVKS